MNNEKFQAVLEGLRKSDQQAATELVNEFGPAIRRHIVMMLTDPTDPVGGASDICQSVLASFFFRFAAGQFDLQEPGQLFALLQQMARNIISKKRVARYAQKRTPPSPVQGDDVLQDVISQDKTPSQIAEIKDLVEEIKKLMTPEELNIVTLRTSGEDWVTIGASVGRSPEAVRKQFVRTVDRMATELGLV